MRKKYSRYISVILSASAICALLGGTPAASGKDITVELDGALMEFDVNPEIINGSTMVPLRKIFEEIGALVKWDSDSQTVSARKSSKTVTLTINSDTMEIDKGDTDSDGNPVTESVSLETAPMIVSGRTLVPARAVSEAFGLDVQWDEGNKKVVITSDSDEDDTWKENTGNINLSELTSDTDGVEIADNNISITRGGDFTLSGTLNGGNISVNTDEKVKLRLSGVSITSDGNPCIYFENADKAYITVSDGTENYINSENCDKGAVYSKDNLEIKGGGTLNITSDTAHGIKASDNLTIEDAVLNINAFSDGIHVNDTFKMSGGEVNITAEGDGIDSESIVNISGGVLNITTTGKPITSGQKNPMKFGGKSAAEVEFEKSTKGINAEWMLYVTGGEITINSASHAVHCADEAEILGGTFNLSSEYEKGISAHGNLTIDGSDTVINVTKATEGIESKLTAVINDGTINITASDDGINAAGGNSGGMGGGRGGFMMPGAANETGNGGGKASAPRGSQMQPPQLSDNAQPMTPPDVRGGRADFDGQNAAPADSTELPLRPSDNIGAEGDMRHSAAGENAGMPPVGGRGEMPFAPGGGTDCLIINGGNIEVIAGDDCIDSNGNMVLNGGTIKAVKVGGSFTGNNSIFDAEGTITFGSGVTIAAACSSGAQGGLNISQNVVTVGASSVMNANETIKVTDESGKTIIEYSPKGSFRTVVITSPLIETGKNYTFTVGSESYTAEISEQNTTLGTVQSINSGRNRFGL